MKKTAALFVCVFMVCAFMAGCKGIDWGNLGGCVDCEKTATLQGTIMDAITGARLGGEDTAIYLVQGDLVRNPTTYNDGTSQGGGFFNPGDNQTAALLGDYTFTNVPAGSAVGTDPVDPEANIYKIIVIKAGYQRFEGIVDLFGFDNKIGNIYLFPENYNTPDYTFTVLCADGGKPVPNAIVLFQPQAANNTVLTSTNTILPLCSGYLPSLQAKTDANGMVTFDGSKLALAAQYTLTVLPIEFEGIQLGISQYGPFDIGFTSSYNVAIVYLDDLGTTFPYGLYVKYISNSQYDSVDSSGKLTIKFNRAVKLGTRPGTNTAVFAAIENSFVGVLDGAKPVNATISDGGLTLELTPVWTTNQDPNDSGTFIQYLNGSAYLTIDGYPDSEIMLEDLQDADGDTISTIVNLTTP
jgi:hypothetical protein